MTFIYLCVWRGEERVKHVWGSEGNLQELVLFDHRSPRDASEASQLFGKYLYSLNHLAGPWCGLYLASWRALSIPGK